MRVSLISRLTNYNVLDYDCLSASTIISWNFDKKWKDISLVGRTNFKSYNWGEVFGTIADLPVLFMNTFVDFAGLNYLLTYFDLS